MRRQCSLLWAATVFVDCLYEPLGPVQLSLARFGFEPMVMILQQLDPAHGVLPRAAYGAPHVQVS